MQNPTGETVSLTAWFPLACALENIPWEEQSEESAPHIASFQLVVDGTSVDYDTHEQPNPKGEDKPALLWASFPVAFPAGQETLIQVSYVLPLHPLIEANALALYYIFQTEAGWAGPIGRAELILNLPYPASPETLSGLPPGAMLEGNLARWVWENFEPGPQDDFSLLPASRTISTQSDRRG